MLVGGLSGSMVNVVVWFVGNDYVVVLIGFKM